MSLLLFGQLLEVVAVLILVIVLVILFYFGKINYISNLRRAFLCYLVLIIVSIFNPLSAYVSVSSSYKYLLLTAASFFVIRSIIVATQKRIIKWLVALWGLSLLVIPIVVIVLGEPLMLEGIGYILLGLSLVITGVLWFRKVLNHLSISKMVGVVLVLYGLHLMDFIVFQYDEAFSVLGYIAAALLEILLAFCLVLLNFAYLKELDELNYSKYTNLFNNSSDAILLINKDIIFDCNKIAEEMFECTKDQLVGHTPMDYSVDVQENGRESYEYGAELFSSALEGKVTVFDWVHKSINGKKIICEISLFKIEENQFAAIIRNLSAKYAYEKELDFYKYYDVLTHVPKRELFMDRLTRYMDERSDKVALIAFNIDNFKSINDQYGHEVGDRLLQLVVEAVKGVFKSEVTITRLGGDEFVIIMNKLIHRNRIYIPIERIQSIFHNEFDVAGNTMSISVCMGVAFSDKDELLPTELLKNADLALNIAKGKGRGKLEFYSENEKEVFTKRITLEKEMKEGLAREEFLPFYQPIVDAQSGEIIGVEALARWQKKDASMVYPDVFIPVAEETGLIADIGEQMLSMACRDCKKLIDEHPEFVIHVNLSPLQLQNRDIVGILKNVMNKWELTARHISLEVTETVFIEDQERANGILKLIRDMGIGVALDDLGYTIIVEGVEEKDQADYISSLGCDYIQGYYFYRPMTFEQLEELLKNNR